MKVKYVVCGICEHWHMPKAHNGHCPICGSTRFFARGQSFYINWTTGRVVIRHGMMFPRILKRLLGTAASSD